MINVANVFTDPLNQSITLEMLTRSGGKGDWIQNQCHQVISMFKIHASDCTVSIVMRNGRKLTIMTCLKKEATTCADNPQDSRGCRKYYTLNHHNLMEYSIIFWSMLLGWLCSESKGGKNSLSRWR